MTRSLLMGSLMAVGMVPLLADSPGGGPEPPREEEGDVEVTFEILEPVPGSDVFDTFTLEGLFYVHAEDGESDEGGSVGGADSDPEVTTDFTVTITAAARSIEEELQDPVYRVVATTEASSSVTEWEVDENGIRRGVWEIPLDAKDVGLGQARRPGDPMRLRFEFVGEYDGQAFYYRNAPPIEVYPRLDP